MYGISKMENHLKALERYDDSEYDYIEKENQAMKENIDAQKNLNKTEEGVDL